MFYKVLNSRHFSYNYDNLNWSLPTTDAPGDWHEVEVIQKNGLHLTDDVRGNFDGRGCSVFEAETEGEIVPVPRYNRILACKARLIRQVSQQELREKYNLWVLMEGESITVFKGAKVFLFDLPLFLGSYWFEGESLKITKKNGVVELDRGLGEIKIRRSDWD